MTDPWAFQRWAFETKVGSPARKAVLSMLAMMAEHNTGRCEAKQDTIAQGVEAGERSVRAHLKGLEEDGIIARRPQFRIDGSRRGDEYLLLAPGVTEWPDGTPIRPPADSTGGQSGYPPTGTEHAGQEQPLGNDHASGRKNAGESADAFPEDLDPSLHEVAIAAGKILKATALRRGQKKEVTRAAVGHAVLSYPDRDHVNVARRVEAWLLYEKGARKPCSDIVARFRNFLDNSEPMAGPPLPAGVSPIRPRGGKPNASDLLNAMGGA